MYDENDLYNEITNTFKSTGHNLKSAISAGKALYDFIKKSESTDLLSHTDTEFVFTGQSTDLRYFSLQNEMPIQLIENIPDEELKNAVKQEFNKAALSGKISINNQSGIISITDKGREFINKPEFKRAASVNLSNVLAQQVQTLGFELNGTVQDLNFFSFADKLDLQEIIKNPDQTTVHKILGNLSQMKDSGLISINGSIAKITDKGKQLLNSDVFKLISKSSVEKNLAISGGVPGTVFVVTKKLVQAAAKTASSISQ